VATTVQEKRTDNMTDISIVNPRKKASRKRNPSSYQKTVGKFMKQGKTMKQAHAMAKSMMKANPSKKRGRKPKSKKNPFFGRKKAKAPKRKSAKKRAAPKAKPKARTVTTKTTTTRTTNPKRRASARRSPKRRNPKRRSSPRRRNPVQIFKSGLPNLKAKQKPLHDIGGGLLGFFGGSAVSGITKVVTGQDWAGTVLHGVYWLGGSFAMNRYSKSKPYARGFFLGAGISFAIDVVTSLIRVSGGMSDDAVRPFDLKGIPTIDSVKTVILKGIGNPQMMVPALKGLSDVWDPSLLSGNHPYSGYAEEDSQELAELLAENASLKRGLGYVPADDVGLIQDDMGANDNTYAESPMDIKGLVQ